MPTGERAFPAYALALDQAQSVSTKLNYRRKQETVSQCACPGSLYLWQVLYLFGGSTVLFLKGCIRCARHGHASVDHAARPLRPPGGNHHRLSWRLVHESGAGQGGEQGNQSIFTSLRW